MARLEDGKVCYLLTPGLGNLAKEDVELESQTMQLDLY